MDKTPPPGKKPKDVSSLGNYQAGFHTPKPQMPKRGENVIPKDIEQVLDVVGKGTKSRPKKKANESAQTPATPSRGARGISEREVTTSHAGTAAQFNPIPLEGFEPYGSPGIASPSMPQLITPPQTPATPQTPKQTHKRPSSEDTTSPVEPEEIKKQKKAPSKGGGSSLGINDSESDEETTLTRKTKKRPHSKAESSNVTTSSVGAENLEDVEQLKRRKELSPEQLNILRQKIQKEKAGEETDSDTESTFETTPSSLVPGPSSILQPMEIAEVQFTSVSDEEFDELLDYIKNSADRPVLEADLKKHIDSLQGKVFSNEQLSELMQFVVGEEKLDVARIIIAGIKYDYQLKSFLKALGDIPWLEKQGMWSPLFLDFSMSSRVELSKILSQICTQLPSKLWTVETYTQLLNVLCKVKASLINELTPQLPSLAHVTHFNNTTDQYFDLLLTEFKRECDLDHIERTYRNLDDNYSYRLFVFKKMVEMSLMANTPERAVKYLEALIDMPQMNKNRITGYNSYGLTFHMPVISMVQLLIQELSSGKWAPKCTDRTLELLSHVGAQYADIIATIILKLIKDNPAHAELFQVLLESGIDKNIKDENLKLKLMNAIKSGFIAE